MMLWDIIRDWFVEHIWGGCSSNGNLFGGFFGYVSGESDTQYSLSFNEIYLPINAYTDSLPEKISYVNIADWLSTMSTIIVLIALCFFFFLMVRWLFRLTSGLIQGRG